MAGLAVVGGNLPELRSIILDQQIGDVFDPQDPRDIARAINAVLQDAPQLNEMKRKARQAALEQYNWEIEGKTLLNIYEMVTQS